MSNYILKYIYWLLFLIVISISLQSCFVTQYTFDSKLALINSRIDELKRNMELKSSKYINSFIVNKKTTIWNTPLNKEDDNIIAIAYEGVCLKKLTQIDKTNKNNWCYVQFYIDNIACCGYVNDKSLSEKLLSIEEFTEATQNGTIYYYWENEIYRQMEKYDLKRLGLVINDLDNSHSLVYLLKKRLVKSEIEVKKIVEYDPNNITQCCRKNLVEALLVVGIPIKDKNDTVVMELYHHNETMLSMIFHSLKRLIPT